MHQDSSTSPWHSFSSSTRHPPKTFTAVLTSFAVLLFGSYHAATSPKNSSISNDVPRIRAILQAMPISDASIPQLFAVSSDVDLEWRFLAGLRFLVRDPGAVFLDVLLFEAIWAMRR